MGAVIPTTVSSFHAESAEDDCCFWAGAKAALFYDDDDAEPRCIIVSRNQVMYNRMKSNQGRRNQDNTRINPEGHKEDVRKRNRGEKRREMLDVRHFQTTSSSAVVEKRE